MSEKTEPGVDPNMRNRNRYVYGLDDSAAGLDGSHHYPNGEVLADDEG